jgi:protein TonB
VSGAAQQHAPAPPQIGPRERVRVTVMFSLVLHALLVLGVTFAMEDPKASLPSLDVILVESHNASAPDKADFLANASQKGGGESEESKRPRSPVTSPVPMPTGGVAPRPLRASAPRPQPKTPTPVVTTRGESAFAVQRNEAKAEVPKLPEMTGREIIERSMEMARLAAEIDRQSEAYAKRPKRKFISANTQEYAYASYMRAWVARVERIGNLNFPDEARQRKLAGNLVMTVAVRRDGSIERIDVIQPSGYPVLDAAAQDIVRLAEPFAPLPNTVDDVDILHITRTWQFLPGGVLRNQ